MKNELMDSVESYLEARIQNMNIYINEPYLARPGAFGYHELPIIKIGEIGTQEELAQFSRINKLLAQYNECEQKVLKIGEAVKLIDKRVWKCSKNKFKCGNTVVTVKAIDSHPYRPGWHLAYSFVENDSVVSADQVKEYRGS